MIIISKNPALAMTAVRLQPDRRDPPHPEPLAVLSPSPFLGIWVSGYLGVAGIAPVGSMAPD